jgi:tryptophan synthase alpha chain
MESIKGTVTDQPAARITHAFEQAKAKGRGVLIPYFMCGYPSGEQSTKLVIAAAEAGADIIELGMPFSDPLADGATIQRAGHIALQHGMSIQGCMEIASQVSAQSDVPLVLMGYYNPVLAFGIERFCATARESGVCGLIIPDLSVEESGPLEAEAQKNGLALIFLVSPTTTDERIAKIVSHAAQQGGGFLYCVSLSGVTGSRAELPAHLQSFIQRVRDYTQDSGVPLAVGFGISTGKHVAEVSRYADGAVVGSAFVNLIDQHSEEEQVEAVRQYIQSLREK